MRYLILNGNPDPVAHGWEKYLSAFACELERLGHTARHFTLRDLNISFCVGCLSCWIKSPGLCVHRDDMSMIYPEIVKADVTIWASPLVMGNVSALLKHTQDRFIALLHPYLQFVKKELRHRRRYEKDIDMGLIISLGPADAELDAAIVRRQIERLALNGRGRLKFFTTTALLPAQAATLLTGGSGIEEAIDESISA